MYLLLKCANRMRSQRVDAGRVRQFERFSEQAHKWADPRFGRPDHLRRPRLNRSSRRSACESIRSALPRRENGQASEITRRTPGERSSLPGRDQAGSVRALEGSGVLDAASEAQSGP